MKIINHLLAFGISTFVAICAMIISTLALNEQGIDDGHIVNIAGRERMLSQLSTKEVFFRNSHFSSDFSALLAAMEEFEVNLNELKERESSRLFKSNDSIVILLQIERINREWKDFSTLLQNFMQAQKSKDEAILENTLNEISQKNIALLEQIDWMVGLFAAVADKRRAHIILVQYICAAFLALIFVYGAWLIFSVNKQLKSLLQKTNKLAYDGVFPRSNEFGGNEISIVSRNISHFLEKLNLTKETSQKARELSLAISDEIANVIEEIRARLKDSKLDESKKASILHAIDLGEDIAIHSSEHLLAAARSLEKLQKILNEL